MSLSSHLCAMMVAFLLCGSPIYYFILDSLGEPGSQELTGAIFASISSIVCLVAIVRNGRGVRFLFAASYVLGLGFVVFWIARRVNDPPSLPGLDSAPYLMAIFGGLGLTSGILLQGEAGWEACVRWMSVFWSAAVIILAYEYAVNPASDISGRWVPIKRLSGIFAGIELGLGGLAVNHVLKRARFPRLRPLRFVAVAVTAALTAKIGQRGPFVFFCSVFAATEWFMR